MRRPCATRRRPIPRLPPVKAGGALAALLLGGCALLHPAGELPPVPPLLSPASLGGAHAASQVLHVTQGDNAFSLQCALQADASAITMIAVGPLGQRVFTLRYDGQRLQSQAGLQGAGFGPQNLPPERVLADMQLAMWPLAAWQQRLQGSDWKVSESAADGRELYYRERLVTQVRYSQADPWQAHMHLQARAGYAIDIEPESATP